MPTEDKRASMPRLVKTDVSSEDLKVFDVFLQKYKALYDNMNMWLKASLAVNSGAIAAVVLLIKESDSGTNAVDLLRSNPGYVMPIAAVGLALSVAWLLIGIDFRRWQLRMNGVMGDVEDALLEKPGLGMWHMINTTYSPRRRFPGFDMADIGLVLPAMFALAWAACLLFVAFG